MIYPLLLACHAWQIRLNSENWLCFLIQVSWHQSFLRLTLPKPFHHHLKANKNRLERRLVCIQCKTLGFSVFVNSDYVSGFKIISLGTFLWHFSLFDRLSFVIYGNVHQLFS